MGISKNVSSSDIDEIKTSNDILFMCKTAKTVDVRTKDPREDLQVYYTANECNGTIKNGNE